VAKVIEGKALSSWNQWEWYSSSIYENWWSRFGIYWGSKG